MKKSSTVGSSHRRKTDPGDRQQLVSLIGRFLARHWLRRIAGRANVSKRSDRA